MVAPTGAPTAWPAPARPLSSLTSAPKQLAASTASSSKAGARPKRRRASSTRALPRAKADPQRELLGEEHEGDEQQIGEQQAVAPLRAALRDRDDAAGVGVGEHRHQAGPGDGEEDTPPEGRRGPRRGTARLAPRRRGGWPSPCLRQCRLRSILAGTHRRPKGLP